MSVILINFVVGVLLGMEACKTVFFFGNYFDMLLMAFDIQIMLLRV